MTALFQMLFKIFAAAGLAILAYCALYVLNALRIAVCAYLRRPSCGSASGRSWSCISISSTMGNRCTASGRQPATTWMPDPAI